MQKAVIYSKYLFSQVRNQGQEKQQGHLKHASAAILSPSQSRGDAESPHPHAAK